MLRAKRTISIAITGLAACAASLAGGCLLVAGAAVAGAGAYVYVNGEYKQTVDSPLDKTWAATLTAVDQLQFKVKTKEKDGLKGRLTADQADGTNVWISLDANGDKSTVVVIRVGVAGNEQASKAIMDKIQSKL